MDKSPKSKLKSWLDQLEQESWQLELIISGFAIFLLIGLNDPTNQLIERSIRISISSTRFASIFLGAAIVKAVWFVTLLNLVIHLTLRCLWISTVGLRYVSKDIELDQLKLAPRFDAFLRRRLMSFDDYIERLEKICSTIFAFTFLLLFVILSIGLFLTFNTLFSNLIRSIESDLVSNNILKPIQGVLLCFTLLYFIDFVSLGAIKRIKWLSRIYYPFYRFLGWITLAPLYRPLYYNLVDNRFGRRVGLLIIPYALIAMLGSSLVLEHGRFFPPQDDPNQFNHLYYGDEMAEVTRVNTTQFTRPMIPSKYVEGDFLEIFLPYNGAFDNTALQEICPDLKAPKKERILLRGIINVDLSDVVQYQSDSLLQCFADLHRISIGDSLILHPDLMFYEHPIKKIPGLLGIIDISLLDRGRHELRVQKYGMRIERQELDTRWREPIIIPFWKTE